MEVTPGYKQTEVGVIPQNWDVSTLGAFAFVTKLAGFEYTLHFDYSQSGPIIAIRALNIKNGALDLQDVHTIPKATSDILPRSKLVKGDLVISYVGTLGRVAVIPQDDKFHLAPNVAKISVNTQHVVPEFLGQFLNSVLGQKLIFAAAASTTQAALSMGNLREIFFARPPLREQREIARVLSDTDALLEGLERLIVKKRDLKQAAMQELLTGRRRLPGFDAEWEEVEFGDIATIRNIKMISSSTPAGTQCVELEALGQGNGRLLGSVNAAGSSSKYSFKKGDVLFGRLRAYLRKYWLASFDGVCSTEIWPLIPRDDRICAEFLHLLVQTTGFVNAAGVSYGTHMPRSDWSVLRKFTVQLPPVTEQMAIAAVLSDMDAELSALEERREKTRALKQAMMQELLTGKTRLVPTGDTPCLNTPVPNGARRTA